MAIFSGMRLLFFLQRLNGLFSTAHTGQSSTTNNYNLSYSTEWETLSLSLSLNQVYDI